MNNDISLPNIDIPTIRKVLWLRLAQVAVNELYKQKEFLVPIHLAFGHESIAVAIDAVMGSSDNLLLSHRNIHYNLTRMQSLKEVLDEYYLRKTGVGQGQLGSMNLFNKDKNINYSSSILGNNLPVGCGFALANKVRNREGAVFIVTGDGAVEEGAFYESLLFLKSFNLPAVIVIENNDWSLATKTNERRAKIDFDRLASSMGVDCLKLRGNDPFEYINKIQSIREKCVQTKAPALIEVELTTLGSWYVKQAGFQDEKFINYHAGPAPHVQQMEYPVIEASDNDPLYVLKKYMPLDELLRMSNEISSFLKEEIT